MFGLKIERYKRWIAITHDLLVIPVAWFFSYSLRFNLDGIPSPALEVALQMLLPVMLVQAMAYWNFGLYRGIWRFASIPDLIRIIQSVLVGATVSLLVVYLCTKFQDFPRSIFPIYSMLLILFLGGSRFSVRWLREYATGGKSTAKRVLIVGAGKAGEAIVRELLRDSAKTYAPVAFIDDKSSRRGEEIHGIRIVGRVVDIPTIVSDLNIEVIMIAMPAANAEEMRKVMVACQKANCTIRTLPGLNDLVSGRVSIDLLREVSLEDLLGRDPVSLDWIAIREAIAGKTVMVSGAGGSIGIELCRQIARLQPELLVVVERCEYNLFMLEQEFKQVFAQTPIHCSLLDVNDKAAMDMLLKQNQPDIIFHAAAYKHVPMLEVQPRVAVTNNVLGTWNIARLALEHQVNNFILVSTDKAVNPTNIMGASKRVAEMICQSLNGQGTTQFTTVRFGNVLGSAGSVVPIFRKQVEQGGPVTVTDPEITRFFMTIPEACQLILQALAIGEGREIFVLDMGEPIKIQFLAEQMIRLAGKKVGEDIQIEYVGLRPGEKLYEELFHSSEALVPTTHEKIFQANARDLSWSWLVQHLECLEKACLICDTIQIKKLLVELVPELTSSVIPEKQMEL